MANSEAVSGVDSFVLYGEESAYNTEQTTCTSHLGLISSFTPSVDNKQNYLYGFKGTTSGGRNVAARVPGVREHSNTVTMNPLNWNFMKYVLGAVSGSGTLTYAEANWLPSITLHRCIDNPGSGATDQDAIWTGTVVDQATIRCAVGGPVEVTLGMKSAYKKMDTTILSAQALTTDDVFHFAGASIELPNGTVLTNIIDSIEITISNNITLKAGLGSVAPVRAIPGERKYEIKFTLNYLDNALDTAAIGSLTPGATTEASQYATIECNFVKGSDSMALLFGLFQFDTVNGNEKINSSIMQDLSGTAYNCTGTEVQA